MKRGFTLIELLVVVLIIGILSAVALPQYTKAVEKSRSAEAIVLSRAIADAEDRYYMANGEYSEDITLLDIELAGSKGSYVGTQGIKTKNFICRATSTSEDAFQNFISFCNRLPQSTYYGIGRTKSGKMACYPYSKEGTALCKNMGTKNGSHYEF